MSIRQEIAEDFGTFLEGLGLNDSYGVIVGKVAKDGFRPYYTATFCKSRILDGSVDVYGPNFILVKYTTTIRHLPRNERLKFDNIDSAKEFIKKNFGDL